MKNEIFLKNYLENLVRIINPRYLIIKKLLEDKKKNQRRVHSNRNSFKFN